MHRGDEEVGNAKTVLEYFRDGGEGIGRARGHRDHVVPRPVVLSVIHAGHERHVDIV